MEIITLRIGGMTCTNCQNKIEHKLLETPGVRDAEVSFSRGSARITFNPAVISQEDIDAVIESLDYDVLVDEPKGENNALEMLLLIGVVLFLANKFGIGRLFAYFPTATKNTSLGMLVVIGLITSIHCVAMCGGINLSQTLTSVNGTTAFKPSFMYNAGRIISYTVIGAFVGSVGSVISLTGNFQGFLKLIAGVFMVIMGINMLGIFPQLRRFQITLPRFFTKKVIGQKNKTKNPFLVGLLNGFMPCGPLQAMQIYALSTGSVLLGALSMFLFSIGTFPLMFTIGAFSTLLSKKFTKTFMKIGATLVVLLGLSMLSQGWLLSGFQSQLNAFLPAGLTQKTSGGGTIRSLPGSEPVQNSAAATESVMEDGKQVLTSTLSGYSFPNVTVKSGTPVEWHFKAPKGSIAGCNNSVSMDYFGVQQFLHDGDNVITFTPEDKGSFDYTCSMGMITGTITVI